jgi:hypothetical protein
VWATRIGRRLARSKQTARVRIARDELGHLRELSRTIDALEAEVADLVAQVAPRLLGEPGFGALTAGKPIREIAGGKRFSSDAKLARAGGIAPRRPVPDIPTHRFLDIGATKALVRLVDVVVPEVLLAGSGDRGWQGWRALATRHRLGSCLRRSTSSTAPRSKS